MLLIITMDSILRSTCAIATLEEHRCLNLSFTWAITMKLPSQELFPFQTVSFQKDTVCYTIGMEVFVIYKRFWYKNMKYMYMC